MDEIDFFQREAAQCRRAADGLPACDERRGFEQLARHYEREAKRLNVVQLRARA
jgi:hypothetical protein